MRMLAAFPANYVEIEIKGKEVASFYVASTTSSTDSEGNSTSSTTYTKYKEKLKIFEFKAPFF